MHVRACMTLAISVNDSQTRRNKFRLPSCVIWITKSFKNTVNTQYYAQNQKEVRAMHEN